MDIFDERILVLVSSSWTHFFRIRPGLHQSFPCSRHGIICMVHNHWYSNTKFTAFPSLLARERGKRTVEKSLLLFTILVSGKREGEENRREIPPSLYYSCFWQERGGREPYRNPSFSAILLSFFFSKWGVLPCYSTQGSVQPQETGQSCIRT